MAKKQLTAVGVAEVSDVCTRVFVMRASGDDGFWLYFYGLSESDLHAIPNEYFTSAMRRRGLDPSEYSSSPFLVESARPKKRNPLLETMIGRLP